MFRRALLVAALAAVPVVSVASAAEPVKDKDYIVLETPVQTANPKKIEVLSFFAYTCPHCFTYEPVVEKWAEKLPADVEFRRIPVAWTEKNFHYSTAYLALEAMGKLDPYHNKLFEVVIRERKDFPDIEAIADFLATQGLDKAQFLKVAKSFSVKMKNDQAFRTWQAYNIDGTPANAVNGRFITAPHMAGTRQATTEVMDKLIAQERARLGK